MNSTSANFDLERDLEDVMKMTAKLKSFEESHPNWFADLDAIDPDIASRKELMHLLRTAPNDIAKFYIFGKLTLRMQLAHLFGSDVEMLELVVKE